MKRVCFLVIILPLAGCAARPKPAIVAAPTAVATAVPTFAPMAVPTATPMATPMVAAPPPIAATPTPNAELARVVAELERLKQASPERDFEAAWADKNTKFVAVRGVGWRLPGVPRNRASALLDQYDAVPIEGTTDFIYAPEVAQLNAAATAYAARYNQLLLAKLDERNAVKTN